MAYVTMDGGYTCSLHADDVIPSVERLSASYIEEMYWREDLQ